MTELQAMTQVKAVCEPHFEIQKIRKGEWKFTHATLYEMDILITAEEGSFTQAFISDMAKQFTNSGGDLKVEGGGIFEQDLDFDVMFVKATINVHQAD